jgi:chromate transporter
VDTGSPASSGLTPRQISGPAPAGATWGLVGYFLRLGATGFGGPAALTAAMFRDLVERRRVIDEAAFQRGMTLAQICPGPLAAQLCFYIGYLKGGLWGATLAGIAFVLPSLVIVLVLGWLYQRLSGLPWMQATFYGAGAAVVGLVAASAARLFRKTVGRDLLLLAVGLVTLLVTASTGREYVALILAGGFAAWLVRHPPTWLYSLDRTREAGSVLLLLQLSGFFAYAGTFVFGSGLAIVPFLQGGVVQDRHWLTERQFIDAVAVALLTPGPVVIATAFIGFLIAGPAGGVVAAAATFLPSLALTLLFTPLLERFGPRPALQAWASGITAGAVGALAGAVLVIGRQAVRDLPTALLALVALLSTLLRRKLPDPFVLLAAAMVGLLLQGNSRL